MPTGPGTLVETFDPRRNSLNFLRLLLAGAVIVSHAWPIAGYGDDPALGDRALGRWAVAGFFAISGYLITRSRVQSAFAPFVWRRVLRIYPGFVVSLLAVAAVFAPLSTVIGPGAFTPGDALRFVVQNAGLFIRQWTIGDTLAAAPYPGAWNGALWTLFYECLCYLGIGLLVAVLPRRAVPGMVIVVFVAATASRTLLPVVHPHASGMLQDLAELSPFFFAGSALFFFAHRVPAAPWLLWCAAASVLVVIATGLPGEVAAMPLAYLCMMLGVLLPFPSVGRVHDLSYGMYVYGFPVQQSLALAGAASLGLVTFIGLSLALTVPLAAASWFLVERPALRLKGARRHPPAAHRLSLGSPLR